MKRRCHITFILLIVRAVLSEEHRYCQLESCPNHTHTLCKYNQTEPAENCGNVVSLGLNNAERRRLLQIYNTSRSLISLRELNEDVGPEPNDIKSISTDYSMKWDQELADIAQRWANQCKSVTDECRNVERFHVEQRAGVHKSRINELRPSIFPLILSWLSENKIMKLNTLNLRTYSVNKVSNLGSSFYTHLMRQAANTYGCGVVRTSDAEFHYVYVVCNYGPA